MGRIIGFCVMLFVCLIFVAIGIWAWRSKEAVGFFTGIKPPRVRNIKAYNHAVAKLWFFYAGILMLLGLPILDGQNSPLILITIIGSLFATIAMAAIYMGIEQKYRESGQDKKEE